MGYYAEQGLKVKFVRFDSAAKMIPSLGSGEVDVGSGATSAGLYNAVKRGIGIKIVSDKARNAKGYGFQAIMVRTDLIDGGKVKSLKDFKGLKVAMSANGNSENAFMNYALTQNGLTYNDIDPVFLGFPEHIPAFANKAIDASLTVEPTVIETAVARLGEEACRRRRRVSRLSDGGGVLQPEIRRRISPTTPRNSWWRWSRRCASTTTRSKTDTLPARMPTR